MQICGGMRSLKASVGDVYGIGLFCNRIYFWYLLKMNFLLEFLWPVLMDKCFLLSSVWIKNMIKNENIFISISTATKL